MSSVGSGGGRSTSNQGRLFIRLKPRNERKLSADQVIRRLQPKLVRDPRRARVPAGTRPRSASAGALTKSQYQFTLQSTDIDELYDGARAAGGTAATTCR